MTLAARIASALALLAFATPALPCGDAQMTTASNEANKPAVAKAEAPKVDAAKKAAPAKASAKKADRKTAKATASAKSATATASN